MASMRTLHVFVPSVKFFAMFVVATSLFQVVTSYSWCTSRSCGDNQVCCGDNGCIIASNCLGLYRSSGSDCSVNESCCNSKCSNTSSCLGYFCTYDSDCSSGQSCCSNKCRESPDCVGYSCASTSDCDQWEFCCYGTCSKLDCFSPIPTISVTDFDNNTTFIIATILGSLGFGFLVTLVICRRQRSTHIRVAAGQEGEPLFISPVEYPAQIYQPLPSHVPPSYQQGYPYYPPPQYEQHRTDKPPSHNAGATKASEQPPSNNATVETNSGGVHPQNSYGAIPGASNLPV